MTDSATLIPKLRRQQAAIAEFGSFAFRQSDLAVILEEAARVCAQGLGVAFSTVCRYCITENSLIVEAGYGWNEGVIGYVMAHPDERTPQGKVFSSGLPFICNVVGSHGEFILPPFYAEHGIVSTAGVLIKGEGRPYGVLEIYSDDQQDFDSYDIDFLTSFANVLSEAVATSERIKILGATVERMTLLADYRDRLLDQKRVLAEELQHRVRNNLQLIYGMLNKQLDDTESESTQRGLKGIARRVFTLAQVYDQLLGTEMTRTMDFCAYLKALCINLMEVKGPTNNSINFECTCDELYLDLDTVTSLGIIVAELVSNSFDHAFPNGGGEILVSLERGIENGKSILTVRDNGPGFTLVFESKRHGVGLVRRLSEQVGGVVTLAIDHGTVWTILFPDETTADVAPAPEV